MAFRQEELVRLRQFAHDEWGLPSHVIPYDRAHETLHESVRPSALDYFRHHDISWWTSKYDKRTGEMAPMPTGHLNSSQVACVNHLEPARLDESAAGQVVANIEPGSTPVALNDGFVEYEWIGARPYLGERGARVRGANVTSLDALMCATTSNGARTLIVVEWKYLESYGVESVALSARGTDRVATYRPLLERPGSPIQIREIEALFYEPYYQLMRRTLLAWQMVEHGEFGASDWIHVHVVPERNLALRENKAASKLPGVTMEAKWRSVLREPERYRLLTPTELLANVGSTGRWASWRSWLNRRYVT